LKVSVITATYNSAATVEDTLRSVIDQDHPDIELIVIDGGSTDATLSILDKYRDRITRLVSESDRGIYDALNKGIALATGEIVSILHSDDFYINEGVIAAYVKVFHHSQADAVYADLYYVDRLNPQKIIRKWKSGQHTPSSFYYGWMPPHPTFFVRREIYNRYGTFDLSFKTAADYELMLRFILKYKISLSYLPAYTVKMRMGGVSNAGIKNRIAANLEDRRAWRVNGLKPWLFTLVLKPLRKIVQFF
jgi:glycosyltransferase involved in cell wall biosynthesis